MQIRAQWVGDEVLLPQPRGEFGDARCGVLADTLQNIDEVGVRVDPGGAPG